MFFAKIECFGVGCRSLRTENGVMDTNHSQIEQQFAELKAENEQLIEASKIRDAEIGVLRGHVQVLSGEVIKCLQDGSYAEQAISTFTPSDSNRQPTA